MDLEVIMLGSNLIIEQYIGANQKIFNYGDVEFSNVEVREPTDDNADDTKCLATATSRGEYTGSKEITFNRADVATRLTAHPSVASGTDLEALARDLSFRLGLYISASDLDGIDLSPVTEPTDITFAPAAGAFAVRGSVDVKKYPPCLVTRTARSLTDGEDGSDSKPLSILPASVYDFPLSAIPALAGLESVAYEFYGGERPGVSPVYIDHGFHTYQKDGKWWIRLYTPLIFSAGMYSGTSSRQVNFNFLDASQQGTFTLKPVKPETITVTTTEGDCVLVGGYSTEDRITIPRGESRLIPYELFSQLEKPEQNVSGITYTIDGIVGAICVTHLTGGVALGLPGDIYVKVTNNIADDAQDGTIGFNIAKDGNAYMTSTLYFHFE